MENYATFRMRLWANLIDGFLLGLIMLGPRLLFASAAHPFGEQLEFLATTLLSALIVLAFWMSSCATPGKMLVRTRIADARSGAKPSRMQFLLRYVGFLMALLPLGLGILWILWDPRRQGWHDKLAGTVVIHRPSGVLEVVEETP